MRVHLRGIVPMNTIDTDRDALIWSTVNVNHTRYRLVWVTSTISDRCRQYVGVRGRRVCRGWRRRPHEAWCVPHPCAPPVHPLCAPCASPPLARESNLPCIEAETT
eukprot:785535-Pyramimonas_sp.AAC.1